MRPRDNPFRSDRINNISYRLPNSTWEEVTEKLARMDYRASVIGPEGSGKTAFLERLRVALEGAGFTVTHLEVEVDGSPPEDPLNGRAAASSAQGIIMLDGADHLSRLAWTRFKKRSKVARGLVVTTHGKELLPSLVRCAASPELLREIVCELTGFEDESLMRTADALFSKHRGNVREALREFYDLFAGEKGRIGSDGGNGTHGLKKGRAGPE